MSRREGARALIHPWAGERGSCTGGGELRALQGEADEGDEDEAGAVVGVEQVVHADAYLAVRQHIEVLVLACNVGGA